MTMTTVHGGQGEMSSTHAVRQMGWGCGRVGWGGVGVLSCSVQIKRKAKIMLDTVSTRLSN